MCLRENVLPPLFAAQVGPTGCVVGIDHMKELVDMSQKNIEKDAPYLLKKEVVKLIGELKRSL